MKAARIHEFGDESVLRYEDAPEPEIGPDQVLIAVKAASINRGDLSRRGGMMAGPAAPTLPFIIGWDVAGDVVSVGANVTDLSPGQRVVSLLDHGGYAELAAAPDALTLPIPEGVSYDQAASLPVAYLTAWIALLGTAQLEPGESCLIQSAGSGVSMAAVQIARKVGGAKLIITTAGSDERCARGLALGADHAINYTSGDFLAETLSLTGGRGVDVAIDVVGGEVFKRSQQALAEGGRLIAVGRSSGEPSVADEHLAARKNQTIVTAWGSMGGTGPSVRASALSQILEMVRDGDLEVVIDRVYPLSEIQAAHRHLAQRGQFGKVLLHP